VLVVGLVLGGGVLLVPGYVVGFAMEGVILGVRNGEPV